MLSVNNYRPQKMHVRKLKGPLWPKALRGHNKIHYCSSSKTLDVEFVSWRVVWVALLNDSCVSVCVFLFLFLSTISLFFTLNIYSRYICVVLYTQIQYMLSMYVCHKCFFLRCIWCNHDGRWAGREIDSSLAVEQGQLPGHCCWGIKAWWQHD